MWETDPVLYVFTNENKKIRVYDFSFLFHFIFYSTDYHNNKFKKIKKHNMVHYPAGALFE